MADCCALAARACSRVSQDLLLLLLATLRIELGIDPPASRRDQAILGSVLPAASGALRASAVPCATNTPRGPEASLTAAARRAAQSVTTATRARRRSSEIFRFAWCRRATGAGVRPLVRRSGKRKLARRSGERKPIWRGALSAATPLGTEACAVLARWWASRSCPWTRSCNFLQPRPTTTRTTVPPMQTLCAPLVSPGKLCARCRSSHRAPWPRSCDSACLSGNLGGPRSRRRYDRPTRPAGPGTSERSSSRVKE